jgi:hypothetical protein
MELDHTEAVDDQSLDHRSFSDYNKEAFVTFKALSPPACKKAAEKVKHNNRLAKSGKKATAPSNNNNKTMVYAQYFTALATGLDEPLAFSLEDD